MSAVYLLQQFPSYSNHNCKKSSFLRTPGFKTLHEWKANSVLAKPDAACTHLYSTVSQLFEPQVQKNRRFHVPQATFLFLLETPLRLSRRHAICCMRGKTIQCLPNAACTYRIFNITKNRVATYSVMYVTMQQYLKHKIERIRIYKLKHLRDI